MSEIVDAFRTAFDGCGPHCGHHADMVELTTLRKSYAAVLDQKRALLREVEALRAAINAYLDVLDSPHGIERDYRTAIGELRRMVGR